MIASQNYVICPAEARNTTKPAFSFSFHDLKIFLFFEEKNFNNFCYRFLEEEEILLQPLHRLRPQPQV